MKKTCSSPANIVVDIEALWFRGLPSMRVQSKGGGAEAGTPGFRPSLGTRLRQRGDPVGQPSSWACPAINAYVSSSAPKKQSFLQTK